MDAARTLTAYRARIDKALKAHVVSKLKQLPVHGSKVLRLERDLVERACLSSGKRIRPILTLLSYAAVGGKKEARMLVPALAFELFHAYTLVHDDVYDEDIMRRNEKTMHAALSDWFRSNSGDKGKSRLYRDRAVRFGVIGGVLGGEILHNLCIETILGSEASEAARMEGLRIYASAAPGDNICQLLDLAYESEKISEPKYMELTRLKSGKLLGAAAEWGAVLGGGSASQRKALREFGELLGQAFQIKDDILDIGVDGAKGRPVGSDIRSGKQTLLTIHALRNLRGAKRAELARSLRQGRTSAKELRRAIRLIRGARSVEYCAKVAERSIEEALRRLHKADPKLREEPRQLLEEIARYMFRRHV